MESHEARQIREALLTRVHPADSVLMRKLLETKMKSEEAMQSYVTRFLSIANEVKGYTDNRKRDIFVDNLRSHWRKTARAYIRNNAELPLTQLAEELIELEGPHANRSDDLMISTM